MSQQSRMYTIRLLKLILQYAIRVLSALTLILLVFCSFIATNLGTQVILRLGARQLPFAIQIDKIEGSILRGVHINQATVSQYIHLDKLSLTWSIDSTITAATENIHLRLPLSQLNTTLQPGLNTHASLNTAHALQLDQLRFSWNLAQQKGQIKSIIQGQPYLTELSVAQNTVTLSSPQSSEKIIFIYQQQGSESQLSATGSLYFTPKHQFTIHDFSITCTSSSVLSNIDLSIPQAHTRFQLNTRPNNNNLFLSFDLESPVITVKGTGDLGQSSAFSLSAHLDALQIHDVSFEKLSVNASITEHWRSAKIQLRTQLAHLSSTLGTVKNLSANYQFKLSENMLIPLGHHKLMIEQFFLTSGLSGRHFMLENQHNQSQYTFSTQLDQCKLAGQLSISTHRGYVSIALTQLQFDKRDIIVAGAEQTVHIFKDRITLTPHNKNPRLLSASGSVYFSGQYNIELQLNDFPSTLIPDSVFKSLLPQLHTLDATISSKLFFQTKGNQSRLLPSGTFTLTIEKLALDTIIEALPIDTSLIAQSGFISGEINETIEIAGTLETNPGALSFSATANHDLSDISGQINGGAITFGRQPDRQITATLDLNLQYAENLFRLDGDIIVNQASYRLDSFQAVTYLPHETQVIQQHHFSTPSLAYQFSVNIDLGSNTHVHLVGFHGKLDGKISLSGSDATPIHASGTLQLDNGILVFYRQALPIEKMTISWFQNPITQPDTNLVIKASGLREIDGRDQMQAYGLRVFGPLNDLNLEYFSSPTSMNNFQILMALMTDSSLQDKDNTKSLDQTLAQFSYPENREIKELLNILDAIKSIPFFDNIDVSDINFDNETTAMPELNGVTMVKHFRPFSVRYRINPYEQRTNRISLDTQIAKGLTITNFYQNESDVGVSLNLSGSR